MNKSDELILKRVEKALIDFDTERVTALVKEGLKSGLPAYRIVMDGLAKGIKVVGDKYEEGVFFLAELVMAGETMKKAMVLLEPYLNMEKSESKGKVVIGTVKGDLHDIGKNIAAILLRSAGFNVIDLGVDVSEDSFVNAVRKMNPDILGLSALLTTTLTEMKNVIEALKREGLRENVKVIIGGAPVNNEFANKIGADAVAPDAIKGVKICSQWVSSKKGF